MRKPRPREVEVTWVRTGGSQTETQAALLTPVVVVQIKSDNLGDLAPKSVRCCTNSRCYHYHNLSKERNSNLQLGEINCANIRIRKKGMTRSHTLATMKSKEKVNLKS